MNHEYRWLEAWHFLHAFVHYYKGRTLKTGNIAGDARDRFISIEETPAFKPIMDGGQGKYYRKGTRDAMYPMNGADVKLIQNGDTIRRYKTDEYYNSFWLFSNLTPGTYEVEISKDGYHANKQEIVVNADETTYVTFDMQAVRNTPPVVENFVPVNNEIDSIDCASSIYVDWNWSMDQAKTEAAFSIEPVIEGTFTWENFGKRLVFTPTHPFLGNTLYTVRIATTAAHPDTIYENTLQEEYVSKFLTKSYDTLNFLASSPKSLSNLPLLSAASSLSALSTNPSFSTASNSSLSAFSNSSIILLNFFSICFKLGLTNCISENFFIITSCYIFRIFYFTINYILSKLINLKTL
jgi:hypothetical protein